MNKQSVLRITKVLLPPKIRRGLMYAYTDMVSLAKYGDRNFPTHIWIEVVTHCNRACRYCPNSVAPIKDQSMSLETFQQIIGRLVEIKWSGPVGYHYLSEPLLHPHIVDLIAITKKKLPSSMPILFTNGDYLTEDLADKLIDAGLSKAVITRHPPTNNDWIDRMNAIASKDPFVFEVAPLDTSKLFNWGGTIKGVKTQPFGKCMSPKRVLPIRINGDVSFCCCDYRNEYLYGNIIEQSILDLWNNAKWRKDRDSIMNGKRELEMCKSCTGVP